MDGPALLDRRLLFVTGKGGVGKTMIAAALARLAAGGGKRVLVCEMDAKGSLAAAYDAGSFSFTPREIEPRLFGMSMNTEDSLREYLKLFVKVPLVGRIGPLARTFDFVADAAPGVKEILSVGKLCYEVRERTFDIVIVDAPATGHVIGQLVAPQAINDLVKVGTVRDQTRWMVELLEDPAVTGAVIVSAPEEMPVSETIELAQRMRAETRVDLAAVIVNKVLPELFGRGEEEIFERLCEPEHERELAAVAGGPVAPVLEAARLAVTLRRSRAEHLARLRAELPSGIDQLYLPYLFTRTHGLRATHTIAEALGAELG